MSSQSSSFRRILKSSSIIGGSSVVGIMLGLVRNKMLAVLFGPEGVGLVSLYTSVMATATSVATMGVGTVVTRQIAEAIGRDDAHALAVARKAFFWGTLMLSCAGGVLVWALKDVISQKILGGSEHGWVVGWLSLGVVLSVMCASQAAMMQGMRRMADMARLSIYGALANTVFGIAMLWQFGSAGLVAYVLVGPLLSFFIGLVLIARIPKPEQSIVLLQEMTNQWKIMIRLGFVFMAAGLVPALVQLWIRVEVQGLLGAEAVGHYQAAWSVSTQYLGFVLGAMGADYYPRLCSAIHDKVTATRLVNEQIEVALLLSAPIIIVGIGFSSWIVDALYSTSFRQAADILRWQVLADILKVASWPMAMIMSAVGMGKSFLFTETSASLFMGLLVASMLPIVGLKITGIAYLACYLLYLPLVFVIAKRAIGFVLMRQVIILFVALLLSGIVVFLCSTFSEFGAAASVVIGGLFAMYSAANIKKRAFA